MNMHTLYKNRLHFLMFFYPARILWELFCSPLRQMQNKHEINIFCHIVNPLKSLKLTRVLIGSLKQTIR